MTVMSVKCPAGLNSDTHSGQPGRMGVIMPSIDTLPWKLRKVGSAGLLTKGTNEALLYDFLINVDNIHLKRFLKTELNHGEDDKVAKTRFELGMMLVTLALIHQDRMNQVPSSTQNDGARTSPTKFRGTGCKCYKSNRTISPADD